jgi:ppGpp synthetase/RelA/SpoT-type nucleotidyltranferase
MLKKGPFLRKFGFSLKDYASTGLRWSDLVAIFEDYCGRYAFLQKAADSMMGQISECPQVHAAKRRVKKPERLIEKIVRRSISEKRPWVTRSDYLRVVPDLIGLRALHLFDEEWPEIDSFIRGLWSIKDPVEVYLQRENEIAVTLEMFEDDCCDIKRGKSGYKSVHYRTTVEVQKEKIEVEIQTRTLYQEAWGEISHVTAYPYKQDSISLGVPLMKLAGITAAADHLSSMVKDLGWLQDAGRAGQLAGKGYELRRRRLRENIAFLSSYDGKLVDDIVNRTMDFSIIKLRRMLRE